MAACAMWLIASASLAFGPVARLWWRQGTPMLQAFDALRTSPRLCGVALYGSPWSSSGGYTYLHRVVPIDIYAAGQARLLYRQQAAFDALVAPANLPAPRAFIHDRCFADTSGAPDICLYRRPGPCVQSASSTEVNHLLERQDQ